MAAVCSAAWTDCGRLVSGDQDGTVRVWDLEGTPIATVLQGHVHTVYGIVVSTTRIFTGSADRTIRVYEISTLTHIRTLRVRTSVNDIALVNNEHHLVSCSADKTLKVWCIVTFTCIRSVDVIDIPMFVALSQAADVVVVSCLNHIEFFNLSTLQCLGQVQTNGSGVALSPCGRWVFVPNNPGCPVCMLYVT